MEGQAALTSEEHGIGARYAGRIGRHAVAYGVGSVATALSGLLGVAIFTRFLPPAEFGQLAVFSTIATIFTLVANLTILPGTLRTIYGTTGDEDIGDVDEGDLSAIVSGDPRLTFSTGLALTLAIGVLLTMLTWGLRDVVANLLGNPRYGALLVLAAGAGAAGAVMRIGQYMLRLQRRSVAFMVVTLIYTFGSVAVAVPLLESGLGIRAVLIGYVVSNACGGLLALLLLTADLRLAVSWRDAKSIMRRGAAYLPVIFSFQMFHQADTLLVAVFASFSQTGLYRVAQRIALPVSYGTAVFQQSWGPMRHDLTQAAVDRLDETGEYSARLLTYYAVFVSGIILAVAVFADQLVLLAAGNYSDAAALVPLTTVSIAGHGWFVITYRTSRANPKMRWLVGLSMAAAGLFVMGAIALIPAFGAIGAPLAAVAAWAAVTLAMAAIGQHAERIPYEYGKMGMLAVLTLAAWAISRALPNTLLGVLIETGVLFAWAGSLLIVGIVPVGDVRALARYTRHAVGDGSKRQLQARVAQLNDEDAGLVDEVVRHQHPPEVVAERRGMSADEVMARAVHALRSAAGGGEATETDAKLGHLILIRRSRVERDLGLHAIVHEGADPLDADLIVRAADAMSPRRRLWRPSSLFTRQS